MQTLVFQLKLDVFGWVISELFLSCKCGVLESNAMQMYCCKMYILCARLHDSFKIRC